MGHTHLSGSYPSFWRERDRENSTVGWEKEREIEIDEDREVEGVSEKEKKGVNERERDKNIYKERERVRGSE